MVARASWLAFAQRLFYREEIAPGKAFFQRRAQQKGRMEGRDGPDLARAGVEIEPFPARLLDPLLAPSRVCEAGLPMQTSTSGLASSI